VRLDEVRRRHPGAVELEWRAFLLRPRPEPRPVEAFRRYTESWQRPASLEPAASFSAWSGEHDPPSHSVPAAVAAKAVAVLTPDRFDAFHLALLEAYFTHNRTVSDLAVLVDVARSVGIDGDEVAARLAEQADELTRQVMADHRRAVELGITGVPAVVIDDQWPLMGAQDVEFYERIVTRLGGSGAGDAQPGRP
jgi:predicted DsbA family dithiol-disulfide isomerase